MPHFQLQDFDDGHRKLAAECANLATPNFDDGHRKLAAEGANLASSCRKWQTGCAHRSKEAESMVAMVDWDVLQEVLEGKQKFHSLTLDVLPCLVGRQQESDMVMNGTLQAFSDINFNVIGEPNHLSRYSSVHNNIIHPPVELGSNTTTVGHHCMLSEGSATGDEGSVKRSVVGCHYKIGSNFETVDSVVMNHATFGDGSSLICSNVQIQEQVALKDCQIGASFGVSAGSQGKGESLARNGK